MQSKDASRRPTSGSNAPSGARVAQDDEAFVPETTSSSTPDTNTDSAYSEPLDLEISLFAYMPPLLPETELGESRAAEDIEELQEMRLKSVVGTCQSLIALLKITDGALFREYLAAEPDDPECLSVPGFLNQFLSTIGSIAETCGWDQDDDDLNDARWRFGDERQFGPLFNPFEDVESGAEPTPLQVARATMRALGEIREDRRLARLVWELVTRLTLDESLPLLLSAKSLINLLHIFGPSNPRGCRELVEHMLNKAGSEGLVAEFQDIGNTLHDVLYRTIRKLGKASVPDPADQGTPTSPRDDSTAVEVQRLLGLLHLVLSVSRTVTAVAKFGTRNLALAVVGQVPEFVDIVSESYDILSTLIEQAAAIRESQARAKNKLSERQPGDRGIRLEDDDDSSDPSMDVWDDIPPLDDNLEFNNVSFGNGNFGRPRPGPADKVYFGLVAAKATLLTACFNVFHECYFEFAINLPAGEANEAREIASELISVLHAAMANTDSKEVAVYAVNAPLLLDMEVRFNLSEMLQTLMLHAGLSNDPDADDTVAGEYIVRWLAEAVTMSGNTQEKWRHGGNHSYMRNAGRRQRVTFEDNARDNDDSSSVRADRSSPAPDYARQEPYEAVAQYSEEYIKRTSLIAQIKDLFPELGEGFIEACLIVFDDDSEKVIMSVLEDQLPTSLQQLDKNMPRAPQSSPAPIPADLPPAYEDATEPEGALQERRNVFDGDEFDLLAARRNTGAVVGQNVFLGKRTQESADDALNDKRFVSEMRSAILNTQYDSDEDEENQGNGRPKYDMYDDELDDSYDVIEPRSAAGLPRGGVQVDDDESTTDEDDEGSGSDLEEPVNPDRARESILIAAAISNPSLFSINEKKSQAAQALCRSTGWSFEQILGWYRMFQSNPKKQKMIDDFELQTRKPQNRPLAQTDRSQGAQEQQSTTTTSSRRDYTRKTQNKGKRNQNARDRKMAKATWS